MLRLPRTKRSDPAAGELAIISLINLAKLNHEHVGFCGIYTKTAVDPLPDGKWSRPLDGETEPSTPA